MTTKPEIEAMKQDIKNNEDAIELNTAQTTNNRIVIATITANQKHNYTALGDIKDTQRTQGRVAIGFLVAVVLSFLGFAGTLLLFILKLTTA